MEVLKLIAILAGGAAIFLVIVIVLFIAFLAYVGFDPR